MDFWSEIVLSQFCGLRVFIGLCYFNLLFIIWVVSCSQNRFEWNKNLCIKKIILMFVQNNEPVILKDNGDSAEKKR